MLNLLRRFRLVRIDQTVADEYSRLRTNYSSLAKGDALIAAFCFGPKNTPAHSEPAPFSPGSGATALASGNHLMLKNYHACFERLSMNGRD